MSDDFFETGLGVKDVDDLEIRQRHRITIFRLTIARNTLLAALGLIALVILLTTCTKFIDFYQNNGSELIQEIIQNTFAVVMLILGFVAGSTIDKS